MRGNQFNKPDYFGDKLRDGLKNKDEAYKIECEKSNLAYKEEQNKNSQIYASPYNSDLPPKRDSNANLVKIIWQLKLRTKLLSNVINQIIYKWPEDKDSILDIVERNTDKYEHSTPKELLNLINSKDVNYNEVINNPIFEMSDKAYPSRVKNSRLGGNTL